MNPREILAAAKAYRCPDCDSHTEIVTIRGNVIEAILRHDETCPSPDNPQNHDGVEPL